MPQCKYLDHRFGDYYCSFKREPAPKCNGCRFHKPIEFVAREE